MTKRQGQINLVKRNSLLRQSYALQHIDGVTLPRADVADSVRQIMR